jgi:membrane protease YdiL (CAAX protease family)
MEVPVQLIIFSIPSLIYFLAKKKSLNRKDLFSNLGFSFSPLKYFGFALGIAAISISVTYLVLWKFQINFAEYKNTNFERYKNYTFSITTISLVFLREVIYTTLGEEIFFRGYIGGLLFRKLNFHLANILQTLIFLLPHLLLLFVSIKLLPFILTILLSGWLLGWLRYKSNSIFPGLLAHTLVNTFAASMVMQYI